ncbi:reverse transcriptase domain-containing protein [Tanacetum coccineum]
MASAMALLPVKMDILGPLPQASGKLKFVIIAIDYFTKWIEAKPLARITGKDVKKFMWDNIVCRFGLPRVIVTDNRTQFVNDPFKGWCESLNIKQMNTTVAHPQANGLVERANKSLMEGIKARLGRERAEWVDELPNILWAHRTSLKQSNGETPFSLTYGSEAVIPAEIGMPTHRTMMDLDVPDESKSQWPSGARYLERKTFRMSPRANGQVSSLPGMQDIPDESKSQWPSDAHYPERKTFRMSPRANGQVTPVTRNVRRSG